MTTETTTTAESDDEPVLRFPCLWCDEPDMWPDKCHEVPGKMYDRCATMIEKHCSLGDHRRCNTAKCTVAARWHDEVRTAGIEAARAADAAFAVVSTIEARVDVVGTENSLGRAMSVLRNGCLKEAGVPLGFDGYGVVYVVRGSDGGLF